MLEVLIFAMVLQAFLFYVDINKKENKIYQSISLNI